MQHLGRANAVQHRLAGLGHPLVIDRRGQRLARTDRRAQGRQIRALLHRLQHHAVSGGGGETDRGLMGLNDLNHVRRAGLFQERRRRAKAQGKHRKPAKPEGKGQGRAAHKHILGRDLQHLTRIAVRDDQKVAVKGHRALRLARGARGKANQRHIIAPNRRGGKAHRLAQGHAVQLGVMVGGAVKPDNGFQELRVFCTDDQLFHQPRVAQRKGNLALIDDLAQFTRPQHGHGVDDHRPGLGRRQPASHHRRVVR